MRHGGSLAFSRFAIVTFLGSDTFGGAEDKYFIACRLLAYQLLHADETRLQDDRIEFIVAVTPTVNIWKRDQLESDGAKVVDVEDARLAWWINTGVTRWKDQFAKLRILTWTEYARILFIDADTLLLSPLDAIFHSNESMYPAQTNFQHRKGDEAALPAEYVFLAAQDHQFVGERDHAVPPDPIARHYRRFNPTTMEQSLFNYAFRRCDASQKAKEASSACPRGATPGPMPWGEVDWRWSSTWPSMADVEGGVVSLHEKLWKTGPAPLRDMWQKWRVRMETELGA
ncbi:unnamed protein product [Parascedosporium putredinis]|uniref:Glycosyltransferase family 8 protein n=1 Tax=Parascedosporium putredinis TaxID=1442378 RepID=A0A9P1M8Q9_9PEZI|nr:unnamed protein product [Parascedosporium putredinis]CAI7994073.1 unnamed protein product [Parascedosporium putredinis]